GVGIANAAIPGFPNATNGIDAVPASGICHLHKSYMAAQIRSSGSRVASFVRPETGADPDPARTYPLPGQAVPLPPLTPHAAQHGAPTWLFASVRQLAMQTRKGTSAARHGRPGAITPDPLYDCRSEVIVLAFLPFVDD